MEPFNYKNIEIVVPYNEQFSKGVNFNPSIVYLYDNLFLISFTTFKRKGLIRPIDHKIRGTIDDQYHVYYGGPKSNYWWDPYIRPKINKGQAYWGVEYQAYWGVGFAIIEINNRDCKYIQSLAYNGYGTDMRLIKTPWGDIIGTMSTAYIGDIDELKGIEREKYFLPKSVSNNYIISKIEMDLLTRKKNQFKLKGAEDEGKLLCKTLQGAEKNWSLFYFNEKLYFVNPAGNTTA